MITEKLDSVLEEILIRQKNVMFRENQYWIVITKSKDTFERTLQNSENEDGTWNGVVMDYSINIQILRLFSPDWNDRTARS